MLSRRYFIVAILLVVTLPVSGLHMPIMATSNVAGNVAGKFGDASLSTAKSFANVLTDIGGARGQSETKNKETSIRMSVERIERDMKFLDEIVSERSQLSGFELSVLMSTVLVAFSSPLLFPLQVTSVLAPTCSAISAAADAGVLVGLTASC